MLIILFGLYHQAFLIFLSQMCLIPNLMAARRVEARPRRVLRSSLRSSFSPSLRRRPPATSTPKEIPSTTASRNLRTNWEIDDIAHHAFKN